MEFHEMLCRVSREFVYERGKSFKGNDFGSFVRKDLVKEARKHTLFRGFEYKIKGSVGAGNWAAVPWIAFFDPIVTTTATKEFYAVYLFNPQTEEFFLSMNQGTTAVFKEFGRRQGVDVLKRRAKDIQQRVADHAIKFDKEEIDLGSDEDLPAGYVAGHAFGRRYHYKSLIEKDFYADLKDMLDAYEALVLRGGTTPIDQMSADVDCKTIEETRRYTFSMRIERAPSVRRDVLAKRDPVCEACGLDPKRDYGFNGPLKNLPLDVHHCLPLNALSEGQKKRYTIPDDFLVLCPTCHRMIHRQRDPANLDALKRTIRFKHMRDLGF